MEIPDIVKNFLSNNNLSALLPVIKALSDNSFDVKKTLSGITPETLMKVFGEFMNSPPPAPSIGIEKNGVSPIANIADKDIVYTLNRYINAEN